MKIKSKILVYLLVSLIIGAVISTFTVSLLSISYIHQEEESGVQKNIKNANYILSSRINMIESVLVDWSHWDDSFQFMKDGNEAYIEINLGPETLSNYDLTAMIFLNNDYSVKNISFSDESQKNLIEPLLNDQVTIERFLSNVDKDTLQTGVTAINNELYLISANGITTSEGSQSANGYLIFIQPIGDQFLLDVENLLSSDMDYQISDDLVIQPSIHDLQLASSERNELKLTTTTYLEDVLTGRAIYFTSSNVRSSFINAFNTLKLVAIALAAIFIFIILVSYYSLNQIVISRILKLNKFLDSVIHDNNLTLRIETAGDDEITALANDLNRMLKMLNQNFDKLMENDERLHLLLEATSDGYLDYYRDSELVIVSNTFLQHLGYDFQSNIFDYQQASSFIKPSDMIEFKKKIAVYWHDNTNAFNAEVRVKKSDGHFAWIMVRGKSVSFDKQGAPTRWIASLLDITQEKKKSEEIIYLLQTDPVTKLQNRKYLEGVFNDLKAANEVEYSIIMVDVNALKLTNDAFGHKEGDNLLRIVGETLKKNCSDSDYPVRWGGDEFLILVRNNPKDTGLLMRKIKQDLKTVDDFQICVSVSMGMARHQKSDQNIDSVIKRAEDRMYHEKIVTSEQVKSEIFLELSQNLIDLVPSDQERLPYLLENLKLHGSSIGLTKHQMQKLQLLANYYSIGKLTLPKELLNKSTHQFSDENWQIYRTHPEAGYRIAKQLPKLSSIADEILCIHEHIDGSGYPNSLKGEEIPLLSRIMLINLMYCTYMKKNKMNSQKALADLLIHDGKQLDSHLLKLFVNRKK
ncbi:diguanylate cyclase [Eubacteriaceae bacterium ES2]|nr:diguanylate cyclase [Eubacteriaceae bacterium ES2]